MPNQLTLPFKKTCVVPIRQAAKEYISAYHTDTHPDAFKWDINRWESLRKDATSFVVHGDNAQVMLSYHAQLVYILTKLPNDIGLEISYTSAFNPSAPPLALSNLTYERCGVLFNLAALYSQLAAAEDRSTTQGLKQMILYSQNAAGVLHYLLTSATPKLQGSLGQDDTPLEFSETFIGSLESLMLAQAQEGVWQRAVMDNYKNSVIAKLAAKVASYYSNSLTSIKEASRSVKHLLPAGWPAHIETKQCHFEAAALVRKSVDDLESNKYGAEVARLSQALTLAKRGHDIARQSKVAPAVLQDIKSLLDNLQKNLTRAERDNDLIYHQEVPAISSLPPIVEASMVQPLTPSSLTDPKTALGKDAVIFGELVSYGARMAIEIYKDRRKNWVQEEIVLQAQQLDDLATSTLRSLNLPGALEALEKPVGLPPSLLKKAEEVRQEEGPARIESSIENVQKLARRNADLLNEAFDSLDQEAEEDEVFQEEASGVRPRSQEANKELTAKGERYRTTLEQAAKSDQVVRVKWDEWEQNITELTWSDAELEAAVPSSTVSFTDKASARGGNPTLIHARQLRAALESLGDIQKECAQNVAKAKRLAESEDITPRILRAAAALEQWVEVQPSMFEDVLDEALAKYDKFREEIVASEQTQEVLLESIKERNALFIQSRKTDPSVKEREYALQSLDLAYHKYREITRNLDEGLQFYNDFGRILTQFRETCREWTNRRRNEMQSLIRSLESVSLREEAPVEPLAPAAHSAPPLVPPATPKPPSRTLSSAMPHPQNPRQIGFELPPPDSTEWESMALPPPPLASQQPKRGKGK